MHAGYLAPVISKAGLKQIDLTNVHKRGGEFVESELAAAASDPELVRATVAEIVRYGAERKAWLVFASGINHANMLADEVDLYNVPCEVITGEDGMADRSAKIEAFRSGKIRALINVNVLTTGFNVRRVDLIALVRATASPGLYVQAVGRGTRTAEGKADCLLLDYGANVERHGLLDQVNPKAKSTGEGEAPVKKCPECETHNPISALLCIQCGYQFPPRELNHGTNAYKGAVTSNQIESVWVNVEDVVYSRWKKEGKPDSIRVQYMCGMFVVSEWLCPDHGGYAASRYTARMPALGASALTTAEALLECDDWTKPSRIKVKPNGKFHDIVQLDYKPGERIERKPKATGWRPSAEDDFIPF
jgi:DNA repair protein RadD